MIVRSTAQRSRHHWLGNMVYEPHSQEEAIVLMLISLFCWGSWANTFKLAGCRFELFYWDYCFLHRGARAKKVEIYDTDCVRWPSLLD